MATLVQPPPIDAVHQRNERQRIIDSAMGTTLAEGVHPGPEVVAISERYIAGEITLQEHGDAIRAIDGL